MKTIKHTFTKNLLPLAIALGLIAYQTQAFAYEAGDFVLRSGLASVEPDETPYGTLDTLNAGVDGAEALGLTFSYMLTNNIGLGLLASTPFSHDITSNGSKIAETELLPPTVHLEYFPLASSSKWQPFLGVGLNYTTFFNEKSTLGDLSLDDSVGVSLEAGLDYKISDKFIVNATVWNIDLKTDADLNGTSIGGIEIDPWVYMISIGYVF
jgi:outer membrane protein